MARQSALSPDQWQQVRDLSVAGLPDQDILIRFPDLTQGALKVRRMREKWPAPSMLANAHRKARKAANALAKPYQASDPIVTDPLQPDESLADSNVTIVSNANSLQIATEQLYAAGIRTSLSAALWGEREASRAMQSGKIEVSNVKELAMVVGMVRKCTRMDEMRLAESSSGYWADNQRTRTTHGTVIDVSEDGGEDEESA